MKKQHTSQSIEVPLTTPLFRGLKHLRIALVGMPGSGKSTLFNAVSATSIHTGELAGTHRKYGECPVQIGFDEARLVDLPSIQSLNNLPHGDQVALQYLLWGDQLPLVSAQYLNSVEAGADEERARRGQMRRRRVGGR